MNTTEKQSLSLNVFSASLLAFLSVTWPALALKVEGPAWVDWGEVHNARILEHDFVLLNTNDTPCLITEVRPDCELCTVVELSDDYILPGESVILKAKLLTESLVGPVIKGIQLKFDQDDRSLELGFRARVEPRFEYVSAPGFVMSLRGPGVKRGTFDLIDLSRKDWSALVVDSGLAWVDASASVDEASPNFIHIKADIDPALLTSGLHHANLVVESDGERIEVPLKALVEKDYIITPEALSYKARVGRQRQMVHYKANVPELYIKKVQVTSEFFKTVVKPEFAAGEYRIYIYGSNLKAYTTGDAFMRIETFDKTLEPIEIPIFVRP